MKRRNVDTIDALLGCMSVVGSTMAKGAPFDVRVLVVLIAVRNRPATIVELCARFDKGVATTVAWVALASGAGLVATSQGYVDRRNTIVSITPKGLRFCERMKRESNARPPIDSADGP